jgi:hypothetical protein
MRNTLLPRTNGGITERTLRVLNQGISSFTGYYSTFEKTLFVSCTWERSNT